MIVGAAFGSSNSIIYHCCSSCIIAQQFKITTLGMQVVVGGSLQRLARVESLVATMNTSPKLAYHNRRMPSEGVYYFHMDSLEYSADASMLMDSSDLGWPITT